MKGTLIEIKNNLQGVNSSVNEAKNQISNLEYKETKNNQQEEQEKERIPQNKNSVRNLRDNFSHTTNCTMGVPDGEEREQEIGNLFEKIMTEKFPNLVKEIHIQVQESQSLQEDEPKEAHTKAQHD